MQRINYQLQRPCRTIRQYKLIALIPHSCFNYHSIFTASVLDAHFGALADQVLNEFWTAAFDGPGQRSGSVDRRRFDLGAVRQEILDDAEYARVGGVMQRGPVEIVLLVDVSP